MIPEFKVVITGDGSQIPRFQWAVYRRLGAKDSSTYSGSPFRTGSAPERHECYQQAENAARNRLSEERSAATIEERCFDVELEPVTQLANLDSIPVAEPTRELRGTDDTVLAMERISRWPM